MNLLKFRQHEILIRYVGNILRTQKCCPNVSFHTATVETFDGYDSDVIQRQREKLTGRHFILLDSPIQYYAKPDSKTRNVSALNTDQIDKILQELLLKNKDKQIERVVNDCFSHRKHMSDVTLKQLLKHYSGTGKPDMIKLLQKYSSKTVPDSYRRNGEFSHYLAKAQCLKGNSEKGLSILKESYIKNQNLRSFYRIIFRELIQDCVMNRSEASLVIFKKYVLEFSKVWQEHYPLVCLWHICWLSSWYSDQVLSEELWDTSEDLRELVGEKVSALSVSALRTNYNEDAVVRLMQTLLKYKMIDDYTKVLEVFFSYRLRNRDLRGCSEILRNCQVLGISLPAGQQGMYIKMLINDTGSPKHQPKTTSKDFKLKF